MPIYEAKGVPDCNPNGVPTMSPHAVNNFVSDLVLMAQAMEQLPQVKAELDTTKAELDAAYKIVQDRELHIIELKTEAKSLHASIRELEVAKDQAETMFLEADDRTARALEFVKTQFGAAGSLIQALEPPRTAIEVDPFANEARTEPLAGTSINDTSSGHAISEVKPIVKDPIQSHQDGSLNYMSGTAQETHSFPEGQSEPDPTHANTRTGETETQTASVSETVTHADAASGSPGPYAGKRYRDVPGYVSYSAWGEGGGTYDNYYN